MAKWLTSISIAFFIGLLLGMLIMWQQPTPQSSTDTGRAAAENAVDKDNRHQLARIDELQNQVRQLQKQLASAEAAAHNDAADLDQHDAAQNADDAPEEDPLNEANLVAAGVNAGLATDILYRRDQFEYQKLALRDKAIRDGYFRKKQYYRELRELQEQQPSLREEIGDRAFDRFLYLSGQNNRVAVRSVMADSPAQQNGVKQGDILLRYNGRPVYSWNEMRRLTSEGDPNGYVSLDIQRNGEIINLALPRGPLGVTLLPSRADPDQTP
jgi:C-terminal processing protease CtpA/Prc